MASSLIKQQTKLSKSMTSFSAYLATRIWLSLLLSLKPVKKEYSVTGWSFRENLEVTLIYTFRDDNNNIFVMYNILSLLC